MSSNEQLSVSTTNIDARGAESLTRVAGVSAEETTAGNTSDTSRIVIDETTLTASHNKFEVNFAAFLVKIIINLFSVIE